jgi:hypothetical protein
MPKYTLIEGTLFKRSLERVGKRSESGVSRRRPALAPMHGGEDSPGHRFARPPSLPQAVKRVKRYVIKFRNGLFASRSYF